MLSENKIKIIKSLDKKKFRQKYNLFIVEGIKTIKEIIDSKYKIIEIYSTKNIPFLNKDEFKLISEKELYKISFLKTPHNALALVEIPKEEIGKIFSVQLVLDDIQDPGNLGTIIRLADWFGISQIICSGNTVDLYNPKVIQASMGSFARVNLFYTDLKVFLSESSLPIYTTDMSGDNLYTTDFNDDLFLVLGNEGNGISSDIKTLSSKIITIPQFNNHKKTESLNVAMATGIILSKIFSNRNSG